MDTLDSIETLQDLSWRECSSDWDAPFYPTGTGTYFTWPTATDVFPWQHSGMQFKRTWPIAPTQGALETRWRELLSGEGDNLRTAFRETQARTVDGEYQRLVGTGSHPIISTLDSDTPIPEVVRYGYRSFDRQHMICDARLADRIRPVLHQTQSDNQVYLTSLLTGVLGLGPAASVTADVPDLHYFRGSFGGKHVIPLWRDVDANEPNVNNGLVELIAGVHGVGVTVEQLFAYSYGILAQPDYVRRFWDELEMPPPRLPITKDANLFASVAEHGARLIYLHTYGERFGGPEDDGLVPQGEARCTRAVSQEEYPADFEYDPSTRILRVGDGEFAPVAPEVWEYSVSGLEVVRSWLNYRKREPAGRKSSPLDEIRPERWEFTEELLELIWVLEATIALEPKGTALLEEVCESDLFTADELPAPVPKERKPPSLFQPPTYSLGWKHSPAHHPSRSREDHLSFYRSIGNRLAHISPCAMRTGASPAL